MEGEFILELELQYGSNKDNKVGDGIITYESFPAKFYLEFNEVMNVIDSNISVNTNEFYE